MFLKSLKLDVLKWITILSIEGVTRATKNLKLCCDSHLDALNLNPPLGPNAITKLPVTFGVNGNGAVINFG